MITLKESDLEHLLRCLDGMDRLAGIGSAVYMQKGHIASMRQVLKIAKERAEQTSTTTAASLPRAVVGSLTLPRRVR